MTDSNTSLIMERMELFGGKPAFGLDEPDTRPIPQQFDIECALGDITDIITSLSEGTATDELAEDIIAREPSRMPDAQISGSNETDAWLVGVSRGITDYNAELTLGLIASPSIYDSSITASGAPRGNLLERILPSGAETYVIENAALGMSQITAAPEHLVADGTAVATITVQLKDANNNNLTESGGW